MDDVFFSKSRIFKFGLMRGVYFILFAITFILTEIGRKIYRPYIYQNGIMDFGFADVIGNLLGTAAIIFFCLGIYNATRIQSMRVIAFITIGVVIYELFQPVLPRGVLDWKDVVCTFAAGFFSLVIILIILRVVNDPFSADKEMEIT